MSKYLVETFYTCTFKIVHKLDELNDTKLNELEKRTDGSVEIIDVKLNNRKTKTANKKKEIKDNNSEKNIPGFSSLIGEKIDRNVILDSKSLTISECPFRHFFVISSPIIDLCKTSL